MQIQSADIFHFERYPTRLRTAFILERVASSSKEKYSTKIICFHGDIFQTEENPRHFSFLPYLSTKITSAMNTTRTHQLFGLNKKVTQKDTC